MSSPTCPDEAELLPVAMGEPVAADVRQHIQDCPSCREHLKRLEGEITSLRRLKRDTLRPDTVPPAAATGDSPPAARSSRRPANVGKYFIAGLLDEGGTAVVYRALHPTFNKELVVKLGRQEGSPAERLALVEEGKLLAQLEHPHLVRVYDLDFHQDRPFLVLEYIPGSTLSKYVEETRLTPAGAASLVAKVARALAEVHRRGLLHQDIHPDHVRIDEAGEPHLDYGPATLRQRRPSEESPHASGPLAFLAPEQARGGRERAGQRSDVFGLGGVLYFLLTGKAPGEPPDLAALRAAGVPRRLEAICVRALAPDPANRHASADELARDLERFVRRPRRVRQALAWAVAVLLAVAGALALYLLFRGGD
jgi:hypothetical protein